MIRQITICLTSLFMLLTLMAAPGMADDAASAGADSAESGQDQPAPRLWALTAFYGIHARHYLSDMVKGHAHYTNDSIIFGLALRREMYRFWEHFSLELEGQLTLTAGYQAHYEATGLAIGRAHLFTDPELPRLTFAAGGGLSVASADHSAQYDHTTDDGFLKCYLMLETTFGLPCLPQWDVALRVHHRSSARDNIGNGTINYVAVGLVYNF